MSATPGSMWVWALSRLRVPWGKMPTTWPSFSRRMDSRTAPRSLSPRRMGKAPMAEMKPPTMRFLNSSALAMKCSRRRTQVASTNGSLALTWLEQRM